MNNILHRLLLVLVLLISSCVSNVVELGTEFGGDVGQISQPHLVMFYAPWCGHCRSLHPIWYEVGNRLSRYPITAAKLDATIYRSAADKFNVKGFPSIRLISSDRVIDYNGDRTADALFKFAVSGSRPLISTVGSQGKLSDLKRMGDTIYLLKEPTMEIRECVKLLAPSIVHETILAEVTNDKVVRLNTGVTPTKINANTNARPTSSVSKTPGIILLKDDSVLEFTGDMTDCFELNSWIKSERFPSFQVGSYPTIHPLLFLTYNIVFYYGDEEGKLREMRKLALQRSQHLEDYYFVHVNKAEYIENLISAYAEENSVVVYNPVSEFYSYTTNTTRSILSVMREYKEGTATLYGGTSFWANSKKVFYRLHSNVWPLFTDHPFIMGLIVMIPIGLIALCCCDEQRSKHDPIRKICEDESQMDLLWADEKEVVEEIEGEKEEEEEEEVEETEIVDKDPELKKDE